MSYIESFLLDDGTEIAVELDEQKPGGITAVSRGGNGGEGAESKQEAATKKELATMLKGLPKLSNMLFSSLSDINRPAEIELEMGVKFSAKAGIVIASADSEAHFKVRLKWENQS